MCAAGICCLTAACVRACVCVWMDPVLNFQERGGGHGRAGQEALTGLTSCCTPDGWPDSE